MTSAYGVGGNIEVQNSGLAMVVSGAYGKICTREMVLPVSTAQPVFAYLAHILKADPNRWASSAATPPSARFAV